MAEALPTSPIARLTFGSHLYGTSTPTSDIDIKEIVLPHPRDILLQREIPIVKIGREKPPGEKNCPTDVDVERITLRGFLNLLGQGNTMALDILFAPTKSLLTTPGTVWTILQSQKHNLLSRRTDKVLAYCRAQTGKYGIKGSRMHAVRLLLEWFDLAIAEAGPKARISDVSASLRAFATEIRSEYLQIEVASRDGHCLVCCGKAMLFSARLDAARSVFQHMFDRFGERARLAERNEGIDWKAVSHAARIGHETLELLHTGCITFPLPNADHIRNIKQGLIPYADVAAEIEELQRLVAYAEQHSHLPDHPNVNWMESFVANVYAEHVRGHFR